MIYGVVYLITCLVTGMKYVGQTKNFKSRISGHKNGKQQFVDREIQKLGWENFTVEILEECCSREQLNEREIFWIVELNTIVPNGYNINCGGKGVKNDGTRPKKFSINKGTVLSQEHRAKISASERNDTSFKNLSNAITAHNLSYTALAKILGITRPSFSFKMCGRINFTARDSDILVEIFGLPAEYLFQRDDGVPVTLKTKAERYLNRSMAQRVETPYKNLLAAMCERKFLYKDLSRLLGFKSLAFSAKMRGKGNFTAKDKARLEEIFGLPAEYLLARVD